MRGRNPAGPGENVLRASPEPSFGMTDSGGQGLPALPIHAQGESQGFRLTTPPPRLGPSFARPRRSAALPVPHPMRRPSGRVSNVFVRRVRLGRAGSPLPAERNDCETRANGTLSHALGRHTAAKGLAALPNEHAKGQPLRRTTPLHDAERPRRRRFGALPPCRSAPGGASFAPPGVRAAAGRPPPYRPMWRVGGL